MAPNGFRSARIASLLATLVFAAGTAPLHGCVAGALPDPPPDATDGTDGSGGDDGGTTGEPDVLNDGMGRGVLVHPTWDWYRGAVIIGSPAESQPMAAGAGEVNVLGNADGLLVPTDVPATIVESDNFTGCPNEHEFAWDLQSDRELGAAFSFYSNAVGIQNSAYRTGLVVGAPGAFSDSGRVMQYGPDSLCHSCAMFPRSPQSEAGSGDEVGTRFGAALGVGFFDVSGHDPATFFESGLEYLAVGAPGYDGSGAVHIYADSTYQRWRLGYLIASVEGDTQCDWPALLELSWRIRTIEGTQQPGEDFGAAIAVADFNCDGYDDLAIGAPGFDVAGTPDIEDAGAVYLYYGTTNGIGSGGDRILQGDFGVSDEPEEGDRFGAVLTVGNFDGSRLDNAAAWTCWDLAIASPGEDDGAGEVQVFYGSPGGLFPTGPILHLGEDDLPGTRNAGDGFGLAMTASAFNTPDFNGFDDLAIGAPFDETGGSVVLIPGDEIGLRPELATQFVQGVGEVTGSNEAGDEFGAALARTNVSDGGTILPTKALVVGVPGEDDDEGAVVVIRLQEDGDAIVASDSEIWRQGDFGRDEQAGDRFGSVLAQPRAFPVSPTLLFGESTWRCEATTTLVASETSCDTEPVAGQCPTGHAVVEPVALPHVDVGTGWDGWIVTAEAGAIAGPANPTMADLALVEGLCAAACELELAANPFVSANCSASGAFETPVALGGEHHAARQSIALADQDGSGLAPQQSLDCNLLGGCCEDFDEDVCPAAPLRGTTAQSQLGRGEEYVVAVSGSITAISLDEEIEHAASISGTIGYSRCAAGNETAPCAYYLGSAHLELVESLVVEVECDGDPYELALEELELDLLQPAMGIDFEDDAWKAFPPGALVLRERVVAAQGYARDFVAQNDQPLYLQALDGWLMVQGAGGFFVYVPVPCNGQFEPLHAWLAFSAYEALEQPPSVEIDMPASVTCNTPVSLEVDTADPDGDHVSLRWVVDGVLLAADVDEIPITGAHEIRAIVRDVRGATTTDTHAISCTP